MLIIREAELTDIEGINLVNKVALGYDYPLEKARERLSYILTQRYYKIFVAETQGKIIGYIHGSDYDNTYFDSLKNIMGLAVLPDCQGNGTGKALLLALENWAKESGSVGVRLVSGYNREEAHKFYRHLGYSMRKEQKNFVKYFDVAEN